MDGFVMVGKSLINLKNVTEFSWRHLSGWTHGGSYDLGYALYANFKDGESTQIGDSPDVRKWWIAQGGTRPDAND